jgi:hypothetical protein
MNYAIAEGGTSDYQGLAVLGTLPADGQVTVATDAAKEDDIRIFLTVQSPGGTVGAPYVSTVDSTAGTFTIASTSTADVSTVAWLITGSC